ncbi:MAG: magnesium/cobalt transporter CorA [bacterium]|nr:magnesium/cobalt transporter CorA [bacterium]
MHTIFVYHPVEGVRFNQLERSAIRRALDSPDSVLWLDLEAPDDMEIDILVQEFDFHPLSIEDCIFPQNRPKLEEFPNYCFIVFHSISYDPEPNKGLSFAELDIFIGKNFIVTVHDEPLRNITTTKARCKEKQDVMKKGPDYLLHLLLDSMVDSYFPIIDQMDEQIDKIEDLVFTSPTTQLLNQIFTLKRNLIAFRKTINPQREIINLLTRRDFPFIQTTTLVYFRDVYDHLFRMVDTIDTYREIISSALEAYLSVTSNQLNSIMKTLTIIATIMMPLTLISSIYGMNFEFFPELKWKYGYPMVLTVMAIIALGMLYYFHRKKWL